MLTCHLCGKEFNGRSLLDKHKINDHEYTPEKLGWLRAGWNKGIPNSSGRGNKHPVGQFTRESRNNILFKKKYDFGRKRHREEIKRKYNELKNSGYRVLITSCDSKLGKVPDLIAVSPDGKIIAIEIESIRPYKASISTYRERCRKILLSFGFYDDVIVESFIL